MFLSSSSSHSNRKAEQDQISGIRSSAHFWSFFSFFSSLRAVHYAQKHASGNMQITPIDYGHADIWGDCTLLTSGGKTLLMDTCLRDKYDTLINYLDDHHFYNFDIYLSHYHYDHMHQIPTIIRDSRFNIGKVYLPDPAYVKKAAGEQRLLQGNSITATIGS